jgi:hypothetical protein
LYFAHFGFHFFLNGLSPGLVAIHQRENNSKGLKHFYYVGESNINETLGPVCAIVMREGSHF